MMKNKITFNEFLEIETKLEIKIGTILTVETVPKSDKILKLQVSFGGDDIRTVVTNIGNRVNIENLPMKTLPFITNLEPAKIMGVMSEAMIMVVENNNGEIELNDFTDGSKLL